MEFFIPGLFLFMVSLMVTFLIVPKATPMIVSILSVGFLSYGVYHHKKLFSAEYRQSTWQDGLKIYAPAIMILAVLLFILYGILSFFTSGQVPIPSLPNIALPSANSITSSLTNSMEYIGNSVNNTLNTVMSVDNVNKSSNRSSNKGNKGSNGNNISRSILETV